MAENMECKMFLLKMPRDTTYSVTYRLKVPNFFTLPEYDGISFEINSPCFEFANATWCFRCKRQKKICTDTEDWIKNFYIYLVRSRFKKRVQSIFQHLIVLDAVDKDYDNWNVFKEIEGEEHGFANLDNDDHSYDRRDTLTFIIDLFVSTEMDAQVNRKGSNKDEQGVTGSREREHIEMYTDLLSVTTDRGIISLRQQFKDLLLNGQDYNVIFNVGDKQFRAHQDILRARSEVFRSIVNQDTAEKNSSVIDVPDCDPDVFQQILTYIYTGQVDNIHANNMFGLYYAAHKYRLADLKDESGKFIMKSLTVTNVCKALELVTRYFNADFLDCVSNYFINNIDDILPTVEWQLFMKENSTAANELFIKSRKKDVPRSTIEKSKDCEISLYELPSAVVSSVSYTLKVPNFFTLPEYDGVFLKPVSSRFFKFANATWHFRCDFLNVAGEQLKNFDVMMVRLSSELPEQLIFRHIAILDADDEEYMPDVNWNAFNKYIEEHSMICVRNYEPAFDTRDNLTLIIHLFYIEPVEVDSDQIPLATVRGFKSLSQDFKNVLLNGQDHDLILNVRDMKFQAHRDILGARSEVFSSMLSHNMQEKNSGVIDVHDCDPEAFKQLLYYIYTENVEKLDEDNMFSLYYAADKYNLTYLKEVCSEVIRRSITVNNVCNALELANKHCDDDILCSATSYFLSNIDDILVTDSWILFLKEHTYVANELIIKSRAVLKNVKS